MKRIVLVSDVHLSADHPSLTDCFLDFLRSVQAPYTSALYVLGDLFDVWLGDDEDAPPAQAVREAFRALTQQRGVALFIQHGNRDFMLGMKFMRTCGATLLPAAHILHSGEARWLLMHGDELVEDDAYLTYRRRIRHPLVRAAVAQLPLAWRRRLAAKMRRASRGNVEQAVLSTVRTTAALRAHGCHTLIHGHLHAAEAQRWQHWQDEGEGGGGETYHRCCLPAWGAHGGGYAEIVGAALHLHRVTASGAAGEAETD